MQGAFVAEKAAEAESAKRATREGFLPQGSLFDDGSVPPAARDASDGLSLVELQATLHVPCISVHPRASRTPPCIPSHTLILSFTFTFTFMYVAGPWPSFKTFRARHELKLNPLCSRVHPCVSRRAWPPT